MRYILRRMIERERTMVRILKSVDGVVVGVVGESRGRGKRIEVRLKMMKRGHRIRS